MEEEITEEPMGTGTAGYETLKAFITRGACPHGLFSEIYFSRIVYLLPFFFRERLVLVVPP